MCFSATASFASSAVLTLGGITCLKSTTHKSQKLLASIPLIFAFHQFIEGVVWLTIINPNCSTLNHLTSGIFLIIAFSLWPVLLPLSAYLIEKNKPKKKFILVILLVGTFISFFGLINLVLQNFSAEIYAHSIRYVTDPLKFHILRYLYILVLSLPFLIMKNKLRLLGIAIIVSAISTALIFPLPVFYSVWCFFGAIITLIILLYLKESHTEHYKTPLN